MTRAELDAIWIRWMHRNDISSDLDDIYLFASNTAVNRMMYAGATVEDLLEKAPQVVMHAGLMYLAELAQDDSQIQRETGFFSSAAHDWQMTRSIQSPAQMQRG